MSSSKYQEKRETLVNGEKIRVIVDVQFFHGYANCGPYAVIKYPTDKYGQERLYSIDQAMLAEHFDQMPNQVINVAALAFGGEYDR